MRYTLALLLTIASFAAIAQDKQPVKNDVYHRCEGVQRDGSKCTSIGKIETKDHHYYCGRHNPDKVICKGTTQQGQPCTKTALKGAERCAQHYYQ